MKNVLSVCLLVLVSSCAEMKIKVNDSEVVAFDDFKKTQKVSELTQPVKLNVIDARGEVPNVIGFGYTGVKYEKTPFELKTELATYLNEKLPLEFSKRGVTTDNVNGEIILDVIVTKLNVYEFIEKHLPERAVCKIEFEIKSNYLSQEFNSRYWSEVTSPGDLGDGTEKLAPTFASCLNVVMNKITSDQKFINLIKNK